MWDRGFTRRIWGRCGQIPTSETRQATEVGGYPHKFEDNTAFAKQENADFLILADPTGKTADAYGVLKDYGGQLGKLANRRTFYISPDGKIAAIDKAVKPGSSGEALIAELKEHKVPQEALVSCADRSDG